MLTLPCSLDFVNFCALVICLFAVILQGSWHLPCAHKNKTFLTANLSSCHLGSMLFGTRAKSGRQRPDETTEFDIAVRSTLLVMFDLGITL